MARHHLVRRATSGDVDGLADCLSSAFEPYRGDYTPGAFRDTVPAASAIAKRLEEMTLFVAVTELGRIIGTVGYLLIGKDEGHIRGMAVRPGYQGSMVAQRLLDAVEAELRREQCSRISLDTTQPLRRAISFYKRNGFQPSGRVSDFFGMPLFEYIKELK